MLLSRVNKQMQSDAGNQMHAGKHMPLSPLLKKQEEVRLSS